MEKEITAPLDREELAAFLIGLQQLNDSMNKQALENQKMMMTLLESIRENNTAILTSQLNCLKKINASMNLLANQNADSNNITISEYELVKKLPKDISDSIEPLIDKYGSNTVVMRMVYREFEKVTGVSVKKLCEDYKQEHHLNNVNKAYVISQDDKLKNKLLEVIRNLKGDDVNWATT